MQNETDLLSVDVLLQAHLPAALVRLHRLLRDHSHLGESSQTPHIALCVSGATGGDDDGDALIVRNAGKEERFRLDNIINVGFLTMTNPERVTLTLREPGILGKQVTFSPPRRFLRFRRSPIVGALIERADQARLQKS